MISELKKHITNVVSLKVKQKISENHYRQYWHVYFTPCNSFSELPKGALIEENIIQDIPTFKINPFGFIPEGQGYLSMNLSGKNKSNSLEEKLNMLKNLTDIELEQLLYNWSSK